MTPAEARGAYQDATLVLRDAVAEHRARPDAESRAWLKSARADYRAARAAYKAARG